MFSISKLNSNKYILNYPILIEIQKEKNTYIGTIEQLDIQISHNDKYTMINDIKQNIISLYETIFSKQKLSEEEMKIKKYLEKYIQEK